MQVKSKNWIG